MKYRIADENNGPFGDEFDTLDAAEAELSRCIAEGAAINEREGDMTPAAARAAADSFFTIVEVPAEITPEDADALRTWLNCRVAEVDQDGDVWVSDPMTGHWLSDDDKAAFDAWRAAQ